ncbi:hypothetical protein BDZ45DRAFT_388774 [Acephala macrosclerotiorum]|nr:hypothetical protein BDZ45DRAFT_388774 [Acephala macrosclerotiorum]
MPDKKSRIPSVRPKDDDDEPSTSRSSKPTAHKTNKSALPTNLQRDKGKSIVATNLFRDKKSSAPASTQLNRDKKTALPATQLNRDKTESRRPDSRREGQASVKPKTIAGGSASIKPKTVAFGNATITKSLAFTDAKSIMEDEKIMKSVRSTVPLKSLATLATAHSNRASMTPKEKTKHDKDVTETNKGLDPCPEAFQFNRVSGGYVCSRGGHGMTDEMLEEGMGAICAFEQDELFKWSMKRGPYYKTEKGWAFNPYRKFKEVQKPRKHGGP